MGINLQSVPLLVKCRIQKAIWTLDSKDYIQDLISGNRHFSPDPPPNPIFVKINFGYTLGRISS